MRFQRSWGTKVEARGQWGRAPSGQAAQTPPDEVGPGPVPVGSPGEPVIPELSNENWRETTHLSFWPIPHINFQESRWPLPAPTPHHVKAD